MDGGRNAYSYSGYENLTPVQIDGQIEYDSWIDRLKNTLPAAKKQWAIRDLYRPNDPQGLSKYYSLIGSQGLDWQERERYIHSLIGEMATAMVPDDAWLFTPTTVEPKKDPKKIEHLTARLREALALEARESYVLEPGEEGNPVGIYKQLPPEEFNKRLDGDIARFVTDLRTYVQGRLELGAVMTR